MGPQECRRLWPPTIDNKNFEKVSVELLIHVSCWSLAPRGKSLWQWEDGKMEGNQGLTYILEPGVAGNRRPGIRPALERHVLALGPCHHPAGILVGQVHRHRGRICKRRADK